MRLKLPIMIAAAFVLAACSTASEEAANSGSSGAADTAAPQSAPEPQVSRSTGPEPGSQADLVANVGDRVFFEFDRFSLKPESRAAVERWSAWLKTYPNVTVNILRANRHGRRSFRERQAWANYCHADSPAVYSPR